MSARTTSSQALSFFTTRAALFFVLTCLPLPRVADGQAANSQSDQLAASISNIKSGGFSDVDVKAVLRAGAAQQVLPRLEEQFVSPRFIKRRGIIADALVSLGDQDNSYWNFLLQQATVAIDSDLPDPFNDSQGNPTGQQPSHEFIAWTQAHGVDVITAVESWNYDLPEKVLQLGATGDPRGVPLLRRALRSRNPRIVVTAAEGLAQAQDKDSIPLIIEACRGSDIGLASGIAQFSLVFFDDPQAQAAVDTYVPEDREEIRRAARAKGMKPFGE